MEMTTELADEGKTLIISVGLRFDYNCVHAFRRAYQALPESINHVTVNMGMTEYIDSSALGMLIAMNKILQERQITISLHQCQETVRKIFTIARFEKMFQFTG